MDFFAVPTLTLGVLTCLFVIAHDRRRVLHFNVTRHPTSAWVSQQLREAFPYDSAPKYLIHDRDTIFNTEVLETMKAIGIKPVRTAFKSPWQNGIAERFVGCCRRDLLDHVIVLNERHLKRLMRDYIRYFHEDRTHLGLAKETPAVRTRESNPNVSCRVEAWSRLGGLQLSLSEVSRFVGSTRVGTSVALISGTMFGKQVKNTLHADHHIGCLHNCADFVANIQSELIDALFGDRGYHNGAAS